MNRNALFRTVNRVAWSGLVFGTLFTAAGADRVVMRTNWLDHWITNTIEVRMPTNIFVNVYNTNWVWAFHTNVVDVFATNWFTQTVTNVVPIQATRTFRATAYKTNWATIFQTNEVVVERMKTNFYERWSTNWRRLNLTNELAVERVSTNYVNDWHTNYNTLTFTNWQTVLVMKTNWVNQPVTNVIQIDATAERVAASDLPTEKPVAQRTASNSSSGSPAPAPAMTLTDRLVVEAARTIKPAAHGVAEVDLKAKWTGAAISTPTVFSWHVEREDGAILCYGQGEEIKRELPFGNYNIELRGQRDPSSPWLMTRNVLVLTAAQASIQQRLANK